MKFVVAFISGLLHFSYLFFIEVVYFFTIYLVGLLFVLLFGAIEKIGLTICMMSAYVFMSLLRNYEWRHILREVSAQSRKVILGELFLYFILLQGFLIFFAPLSSLVPVNYLEKFNFTYALTGNICALDENLAMTKEIFGDKIDYSKVQFIQGGLPRTLWFLDSRGIISKDDVPKPMTFDNTVYIYDFSKCPSVDVYFHQMTHIWQMQKYKYKFFGVRTIPMWVTDEYFKVADPDVLASYGGSIGLKSAKAQGKSFIDFGSEQQATIVEDYYWANNGVGTSSKGENFSQDYRDLMGYFVQQIKEN